MATLTIEQIMDSRVVGLNGATEYQAKCKNYMAPSSYAWVTEADIIAGSPGNRRLLDQFKHRNRRTKILSPDEAARARPGDKRSRPSLADEQLAKRRHTSASSVDNTPEYEPPAAQPEPVPRQPREQRQRNPSGKQARLEKLCTVRKHKEKLHSNSKDINSASLLQRSQPGDDRAAGPSGLVATRKDVQPPQLILSAFEKSASLAQALSRPSPVGSLTDAIGELGRDTADFVKLAPAPSLRDLQRLVDAGDSVALFAAARRVDRATLNSDIGNSCRLLHAAARAGQRAPDLLLALLIAGVKPDTLDADGFTPLMLAAQDGDAAAVRRLLQFGVLPDSGGESQSALLLAARAHHWDAAAALLHSGAEFDELLRCVRLPAYQLSGWTNSLAEPLLKALRGVTKRPFNLVSIQLPHLVAVAPGASRVIEFVTPNGLADTDFGLLLAGFVELDGCGGVLLRKLAGHDLLGRLELNGRELAPLLNKDCLYAYPTDLAGAPPGETNRLRLAFRPHSPVSHLLKLVLLPAACGRLLGSGAGPG